VVQQAELRPDQIEPRGSWYGATLQAREVTVKTRLEPRLQLEPSRPGSDSRAAGASIVCIGDQPTFALRRSTAQPPVHGNRMPDASFEDIGSGPTPRRAKSSAGASPGLACAAF
jgi:hypothetical protein